MVKTYMLASIVLILLLSSFAFAVAEEDLFSDNSDSDSNTSTSDIEMQTELSGETIATNKAYSWLAEQVSDWESLSSEETAFALLALSWDDEQVKKGTAALYGKSKNEEKQCWPSECKVKETALSALALNRVGIKTKVIEDWLLNQSKVYSARDLDWFVQIDSDKKTNCSISYAGKADSIIINENKKLVLDRHGSPECLSLSEGNYWLSIDDDCLENTYSISCADFATVSLIYQKEGILYVSSKSTQGRKVDVKIESICLANKGACDYEGTLWGSYLLSKKDRDVDVLLPYMVSQSDLSEKYMPDAFLYLVTEEDDYADSLLSKQTKDGYWLELPSKYYDSALAAMALKDYYFAEENITALKEYLLRNQEDAGSWGNSVESTAFILYSLWPKKATTAEQEENVCEEHDYICRSKCEDDEETEIKYNYGCATPKKCCKDREIIDTCKSMADCADISCDKKSVKDDEGNYVTCEYGKEITCDDGFDNDYDKLIDDEDDDCKESDCARNGYLCCNECDGASYEAFDDSCTLGKVCCESCTEKSFAEICNDKIDNDDDTFIDCKDPSCASDASCKKTKWWLWVIIVLVIGGAVTALVVYMKKNKLSFSDVVGKIKSKFSKKPEQVVAPRFGRQTPMLTRMQPRFMPRTSTGREMKVASESVKEEQESKDKEISKTQKEIDETLKKLKELSEE